jgi:hypothetical protein
MSRMKAFMAQILIEHRQIQKMLCVTTSTNNQRKVSNKSKLKNSKPKANANYKSTKPMKSKSTSQFRNKSNI